MNTQTFYIAKSGYKGLIVLAVLLLVSLVLDLQSLSCIFLGLLILWCVLFRNPERNALHISSNAFLAPIDGEIKDIQTQGEKTLITLQVGAFCVGALRSPIELDCFSSKVCYGAPLLFAKAHQVLSPQTTLKSEKFQMKIFSQFLHIPSLDIAGEKIARGERIGFVKIGRVEIEVSHIELKVNIGDKVLGGESVLGYLQ